VRAVSLRVRVRVCVCVCVSRSLSLSLSEVVGVVRCEGELGSAGGAPSVRERGGAVVWPNSMTGQGGASGGAGSGC
jgi:hypothetical protein